MDPAPFSTSAPIAPVDHRFTSPTDGDRTVVSGIALRTLMVGEHGVMVESRWPKGVVTQVHQHDDHESYAYLVSGRMRVTIGDETFIAEPGAAWLHPIGVPHCTEALEDCVQIEVKSPARRTW